MLLLLAGCVSGGGGDLLFLSNAAGDHDLYLLSKGELQRLTSDAGDDMQASWSPDGNRIVLTSNLGGNAEVRLLDLRTGIVERITDYRGLDASPAWSPDGSTIAFVSSRSGVEQIYLVAASGGEQRRLYEGEGSAIQPVFSPEGDRLAFLEGGEDGRHLAVINVDGTSKRRLVADPRGHISSVTWAPGGDRLLYTTNRKSNTDIYTVEVETGLETRMTSDPWIDSDAVFSPDGTRIAWFSARDDTTRRQLYMMRADGTDMRRLSASGVEEMHASFSPDGSQIAFVAYRDRQFRLNLLDLETGSRFELRDDLLGGYHFAPVYKPRGKRVIATVNGSAWQPSKHRGAQPTRIARNGGGND